MYLQLDFLTHDDMYCVKFYEVTDVIFKENYPPHPTPYTHTYTEPGLSTGPHQVTGGGNIQ